jgi:hypothetical protein
MAVWYDNFDSTFFLTIGGIAFGFFGLLVRSCYKSKCDVIEIGCLKIHRAVEQEEKIDELNIQHHETKSDDNI